tara:strand:- start:19707 stop:19997 length:291 start_codon:yes stop_codon:yes gene_type:complete
MKSTRWPQARIDKLVALYRDGVILDDIAEALDTPVTTIKSRIRVIREEYNLPYRDPKEVQRKARPRNTVTSYDKRWSGPIPRGHWMITKPWKKNHG